jgi:predicted nucleic acid-binding protein
MSAEGAVYLDSSAIVKLAIREVESVALRQYLRRRRTLVSSALAKTEVARAVLSLGDQALARCQAVLDRIELVRINDRVLGAAGSLLSADVRSLDAIHLATAVVLGESLRVVITYDDRMAVAARAQGLKVVAPK